MKYHQWLLEASSWSSSGSGSRSADPARSTGRRTPAESVHLAPAHPRHRADEREEVAVAEVAVVVRQDVALAGAAVLLGLEVAGDDVAGVDVGEPARRR